MRLDETRIACESSSSSFQALIDRIQFACCSFFLFVASGCNLQSLPGSTSFAPVRCEISVLCHDSSLWKAACWKEKKWKKEKKKTFPEPGGARATDTPIISFAHFCRAIKSGFVICAECVCAEAGGAPGMSSMQLVSVSHIIVLCQPYNRRQNQFPVITSIIFAFRW